MKKDKKYKCLIIEDEPIAAEIIESFIKKDAQLELVETCSNAINASEVLKKTKIDLIFLDLHLPILKGFDFLRKIVSPPAIIVTTAFHEYALEGYELDILDYLLKPIPYSKFEKSIQKFKHYVQSEEALLEYKNKKYITVHFAKKQYKIFTDEIFYIESFREYIVIHTEQESFKIKMPMTKIESILQPYNFIRVHKSYIVSFEKIKTMSANELTINSVKIPIGRNYKNQLNEYKLKN